MRCLVFNEVGEIRLFFSFFFVVVVVIVVVVVVVFLLTVFGLVSQQVRSQCYSTMINVNETYSISVTWTPMTSAGTRKKG